MQSRYKPSTNKTSSANQPPRHRVEKINPSASDKEAPWLSNNMGSQKVHFNPTAKRNNRNLIANSPSTDPVTTQHEDNVVALHSEWETVKTKLNKGGKQVGGVTQYVEKSPNPAMEHFRPFDLEEFWGQKQLRNVQT